MWVSRLYLRWYKSFNTRYHGYVEDSYLPKPWELRTDELFPFVEIPLERQITTIVGANEAGKSHLLSATEKIFKGHSTSEIGNEKYDSHHICRYCAIDGLEEDVWPGIGMQLNFSEREEYQSCLKSLEITTSIAPKGPDERILRVFIDGERNESEFAIVFDNQNRELGKVEKSKWFEIAGSTFPKTHFINSRLALSNEVHIQQLLDMYTEQPPSVAYDPLALHQVASVLFGLELVADKPAGAVAEQVNSLRAKLKKSVLGPSSSVMLEHLLFAEILGVSKGTLEKIKELGAQNRGYVERLVEEINHRLEETLDISHFWQQDDDFTLQVDYKGGFFYFLITDKTGAKYTFNERSSGLRYFLSYYIQARAIKKSTSERGSIVLMDEPDSFLSAAAQRNLLQVFESLVAPDASGAVQLIYTTHSPFLINRNFPQRISLLRKGDGSEGTQLVEWASARRYEPIRSGLGIDCAETLFVGTMNVVLEGISDQKVIVSAIQKFGDPARIDELLDLNKVTFVSADGVWKVPALVEKSTSGSEKRPVVVALLDGDPAGQQIAQELHAKELLDENFVATLDQVGLDPEWNDDPRELEDLIPPRMLAATVKVYAMERWGVTVDFESVVAELSDKSTHSAMSKRLIAAARSLVGADLKDLDDIAIKGGILDEFVKCLLDTKAFEQDDNLQMCVKDFEKNIRMVCAKLKLLLSAAEDQARRDKLQKTVRLSVERFEKSHRSSATKADVERCLQRIDDACIGGSIPARSTRENVIQLRCILDDEVVSAGAQVEIEVWLKRLRILWETPWRNNVRGWKSGG